jgi:hypothetical protein
MFCKKIEGLCLGAAEASRQWRGGSGCLVKDTHGIKAVRMV